MNDCLCGTCPACRREMRELDRMTSVKAPESLSYAARKILSEGAYTVPNPTPREKIEREKKRTASTRARNVRTSNETRNERRTRRKGERIEIDGRMVHPDAKHGTLTGYSEHICRCPPCTEANSEAASRRYKTRRDGTPDMRRRPGGGMTHKELKEFQRSKRVLIDGVMVHPTAPHGTPSGYDYYGCKCQPCLEANSSRKRLRLQQKRENKVA